MRFSKILKVHHREIINRKSLIFIGLTIMVTAGCAGFGEKIFDKRVSEGIIEYKVTFPGMSEDNLLLSLLPDKIKVFIRNNNYVTDLETIGGVFKTRIISKLEPRVVDHQLKIFKKQIRTTLDEKQVNHITASMPQMTIIKTNITDTIAGFLCHKAIGIYDDPEMSEIDIYYTKSLKIDNPNWCNQYAEIDGFLVCYEIEQYGIRMRLEATSFSPVKVEDEIFIPEKDYDLVTPEAMEVEMEELLITFDL